MTNLRKALNMVDEILNDSKLFEAFCNNKLRKSELAIFLTENNFDKEKLIEVIINGFPKKEPVDVEKINPVEILEKLSQDSLGLFEGLSGWEQSFISDILSKYYRFGENIHLSEKQITYVRKIANKIFNK